MQKCLFKKVAMNWDNYRFFLAVARAGQLSTAARQMGLDHATISRHIKSLEAQLGVKLFDTSPQGYTPTAEAAQLIPLAEQIESATIAAEGVLGAPERKLSGTVRIGVPDGVGAYVVTDAVIEIRRRYPDIEVQILAMPRNFSLSKREVDFAISVSPPRAGRTKVRKICDYKLHLYASDKYIENHRPVRKTSDLKHHTGVGYIPELLHDKMLDYVPLIASDFTLEITSTSVHVQLQAILKGAGVGIVHDFMAVQHPQLRKVLPKKISFTRSFWMSVHEDYAGVERIRRTMDVTVSELKRRLITA